MINTLKRLFSSKPKVDLAVLAKDGAVILDVRSSSEYTGGHIRGSINIPVNKLPDNLHKLKDKNKPIITCCASGMRSASAKGILKANGFTNVHNGGGWQSLNHKIK